MNAAIKAIQNVIGKFEEKERVFYCNEYKKNSNSTNITLKTPRNSPNGQSFR